MRIALAQMEIPWHSYYENQKKCRIYFEQAKKAGSEIVVFPEMTLTGFEVKSPILSEKEEETVAFFKKLTKEYEICAVFGYAGAGTEKKRNHLMMANRGQRLMEYEKIHPFSFGAEGKYFEGGESVKECLFHGEHFSAAVCYDLRFPEIFQEMSKKSDCIFVIANWPVVRSPQWSALLKARAIENLCYVVGVNCTGQSGNLMYEGMSAVYGPDGSLIAGEQKEEGLIEADLDFDWLRKYQEQFPFKRDRRPDIYKHFYL